MNCLIVFFDVGGTLIDTPDLSGTITKRLTSKWPDNKVYGLVSETLVQIDQYKQEQPFRSIEDIYTTLLASLAKKYGYKDISDQAHDIYLDVALYKSRLFPETISVLEQLINNRVKMIIASDEDTEIMEEKLVKHNLSHRTGHG